MSLTRGFPVDFHLPDLQGAWEAARGKIMQMRAVRVLDGVLKENSMPEADVEAFLAALPEGDGQPIVVVPGFGMNDAAYAQFRALLRMKGYKPYESGIGGRNMGTRLRTLKEIELTIDRAAGETGKPVLIIGFSVGGALATGIVLEAQRQGKADHIAGLVTVNAPLRYMFNGCARQKALDWLPGRTGPLFNSDVFLPALLAYRVASFSDHTAVVARARDTLGRVLAYETKVPIYAIASKDDALIPASGAGIFSNSRAYTGTIVGAFYDAIEGGHSGHVNPALGPVLAKALKDIGFVKPEEPQVEKPALQAVPAVANTGFFRRIGRAAASLVL